MSTTEAEYIAASMASRELVWLRQLLKDIHNPCNDRTILWIDNQSAIKLIRNPEFHRRTKHIDIYYHFVRERFDLGDLCTKYVKTEMQLADFLTKALKKERFATLIREIGMFNNECENS